MSIQATSPTPLNDSWPTSQLANRQGLKALAQLLTKMAPYDGQFQLTPEGINVTRSSHPASERTFLLAHPSICIVSQGAKAVSLVQGEMEYVEDASTMVVYAAEIPITVKITEASVEQPYFCLMIPLHAKRLNELMLKVFPNGVPKTDRVRSVYVGNTDPNIVKSAYRLVELIEQQDTTDLLVPLAIDEILIRLLRSPEGPAIAQIGITDSHAEKVTKAISWLKDNYSKPVKMDELARITGMSVSSFHSHFKAITSMTPLQFQKTLRLQEARSLMRTKMLDVSTAAFTVGYSSSSQFSREYAREFGVPPSKDEQIHNMS